jgi:hypothetical protein
MPDGQSGLVRTAPHPGGRVDALEGGCWVGVLLLLLLLLLVMLL